MCFDNFYYALLIIIFENAENVRWWGYSGSMYNGIKSCIAVNGTLQVKKASDRGKNLPPLLFAIYLNDLENIINSSGLEGIKICVQINEFTISDPFCDTLC